MFHLLGGNFISCPAAEVVEVCCNSNARYFSYYFLWCPVRAFPLNESSYCARYWDLLAAAGFYYVLHGNPDRGEKNVKPE